MSGHVLLIEYVDTVTGIEGEALSWEFAKTADEATIKARAHFLLFKARFGAQGYRILSPTGLLLVSGPEAPELDAHDSVANEPLLKRDHVEKRHRAFTQGPHIGRRFGRANFGHSKSISGRVPKAGVPPAKPLRSELGRHWPAIPRPSKPFPTKLESEARLQRCGLNTSPVVEGDGLIPHLLSPCQSRESVARGQAWSQASSSLR